ncbi:hypothetical protein ACRF5P_004695, partial [Escherichia coli]
TKVGYLLGFILVIWGLRFLQMRAAQGYWGDGHHCCICRSYSESDKNMLLSARLAERNCHLKNGELI